MSVEQEKLYTERLHRYVTACYNKKPDRIPIRLFAEELAAKYAGYNNFEAAVDHELQFDVNRKFAVDMKCDAIQTNSIVNWMGMMKALGWKGISEIIEHRLTSVEKDLLDQSVNNVQTSTKYLLEHIH